MAEQTTRGLNVVRYPLLIQIAGILAVLLSAQAFALNQENLSERKFDDKTALEYSQDALGRMIGDYNLLDREGRSVNLADYRGKPLIVSLIYSSCFHTCPVITQHLARAIKLARSAVGEDSFNIVSIGFDVRHDRPETMKTFARQRRVSRDPAWEFLSSDDEETILRLTEDLGFIFIRTLNGFDHLAQVTVIDAEGKVFRQVYGENLNPPVLVEALKELVFGDVATSDISLSRLINKARLWCTIYDPKSNTYRFDYTMAVGLGISFVVLIFFAYIIIRMWIRLLSTGGA